MAFVTTTAPQSLICNQGVTGSIPVGGTKFPNDDNGLVCCRRFHFVSRKVINSYKQIFGGGVKNTSSAVDKSQGEKHLSSTQIQAILMSDASLLGECR